MLKSIIKYGLLSGIVVVAIPAIFEIFIGNDESSFAISELVGYFSILAALSLVFFANKKYLAEVGTVSFKSLWLLGLGVTSISSFMFGLYNVIYVAYIDPTFQEKYFEYSIEKIKNSGVDSRLIEQQVSQLESQKELFFDPTFNFLIMFLTVFVIGLVLSGIFAWIQKK
ncbi:MAG: DUF4199 domain-containing protein [Enterobacterales bacterium]|nr:DUF4199 domain-containing protein [Enterobacterales bacterium]